MPLRADAGTATTSNTGAAQDIERPLLRRHHMGFCQRHRKKDAEHSGQDGSALPHQSGVPFRQRWMNGNVSVM